MMLPDSKPNIVDIVIHAIVGIGIGLKYGPIEGLFCFSVVSTLDQILWYLGRTK